VFVFVFVSVSASAGSRWSEDVLTRTISNLPSMRAPLQIRTYAQANEVPLSQWVNTCVWSITSEDASTPCKIVDVTVYIVKFRSTLRISRP
jgi:hypothetical protein